MSDYEEQVAPDLEAEGAGETVGEAKWTALRQLEQRFPGLDKSQVEFVVLSEGERGLLGVGFVPARVIARVSPAAAVSVPVPAPARPAPPRDPLSPAGERLADLLEHVRQSLSLDASVSVRESGSELVATYHGRELGLVIGKHGQTIDAVQYLASAIVNRLESDEHVDVIVDAAGYRDRRRATLETAADRAASRALAIGESVELEPMTAAERKLVHLRLKDRDDVVTSSEGLEPNRHVVVSPTA